jgi:hypothetical protein
MDRSRCGQFVIAEIPIASANEDHLNRQAIDAHPQRQPGFRIQAVADHFKACKARIQSPL